MVANIPVTFTRGVAPTGCGQGIKHPIIFRTPPSADPTIMVTTQYLSFTAITNTCIRLFTTQVDIKKNKIETDRQTDRQTDRHINVQDRKIGCYTGLLNAP